MKKSSFGFLVLGFLILSLGMISAEGVSSYCLTKGQILEFSKCNPNMNDYHCDSSLCQLCAEETNGVYCPKSPNVCNAGNNGCKYLNQEITPEIGSGDNGGDGGDEANPQPASEYIILLTPDNEKSYADKGVIDFTYKVSESYRFETCELILNGKSVASKNKPISYSTQKFSLFVDTGYYKWKIKCTMRSNYNSAIEISESRDLLVNVDEIIPEILLVSPEDGFSTTNQDVTFSYEFSEQPYNLESCSLKLNEDLYGIELSGGLANNYSQLVSPGSYTWNIQCLINGNNIASESRNLIISEVPVVDSGGGGGGGSGGGGSSGGGSSGGGSSGGGICTTQWNCTEWSECVDNLQTRICSKIKESCNAGEKPEENQSCGEEGLVSNDETNNAQEDETSTNIFQKGLTGITGAVVGTTNSVKNNKLIAIGVFIALLVVAGALSYYYKKK